MQKNKANFREWEDSELVSEAQNGDGNAFAELARRHQSYCYNLALSILRNRQDAEDELQNALWKAYAHIGQFQQDSKFSTWLTRIVVNQCLMSLRRAKRAKLLYLDDASWTEDLTKFELPDNSLTPERNLVTAEVARILHKEVSRLPKLLRSVFVLREMEETSMEETALRLGISVAAAKSRLLRARAELRARLLKHCGRMGPATLTAELVVSGNPSR